VSQVKAHFVRALAREKSIHAAKRAGSRWRRAAGAVQGATRWVVSRSGTESCALSPQDELILSTSKIFPITPADAQGRQPSALVARRPPP